MSKPHGVMPVPWLPTRQELEKHYLKKEGEGEMSGLDMSKYSNADGSASKAPSLSDPVAGAIRNELVKELTGGPKATPGAVNSELAANRQSRHVSAGVADLLLVRAEGLTREVEHIEALQAALADQHKDASSALKKLEATIGSLRG